MQEGRERLSGHSLPSFSQHGFGDTLLETGLFVLVMRLSLSPVKFHFSMKTYSGRTTASVFIV